MDNLSQIRTDNLHHTMMKLFCSRERDICPKCKSEEWYKIATYIQQIEVFTDRHEIEGHIDYDWSSYQCEDCGHNIN